MPTKSRPNLQAISDQQLMELKPWLEEIGEQVEQPEYIQDDPIQFMHAFDDREDQLLAGFYAATLAWGRRDIVNRKVDDLLNRMDYQPYAFIKQFSEKDSHRFEGFKHRTFKPVDIYWITRILSTILDEYGSFETFWKRCYQLANQQQKELMTVFHEQFFDVHPEAANRTRKHISNASKNSSCKRLYLYLRWSVRDSGPVDLGVMNFIKPSELKIPLDVHVARQSRKLGLLTRTYNDWKAVCELTGRLKQMNPEDPAWFDYPLFGLGIGTYELAEKFILNPTGTIN